MAAKKAKAKKTKSGQDPFHKRASENEPCAFCKVPTRRRVKFGYLTFFQPCCVRCEG